MRFISKKKEEKKETVPQDFFWGFEEKALCNIT